MKGTRKVFSRPSRTPQGSVACGVHGPVAADASRYPWGRGRGLWGRREVEFLDHGPAGPAGRARLDVGREVGSRDCEVGREVGWNEGMARREMGQGPNEGRQVERREDSPGPWPRTLGSVARPSSFLGQQVVSWSSEVGRQVERRAEPLAALAECRGAEGGDVSYGRR
jgi:hypothetical protein